MKKSIAMLAVAAVAVQASRINVKAYDYDDSEDWLKVYAGVTAGMMTAFVADQSTN